MTVETLEYRRCRGCGTIRRTTGLQLLKRDDRFEWVRCTCGMQGPVTLFPVVPAPPPDRSVWWAYDD